MGRLAAVTISAPGYTLRYFLLEGFKRSSVRHHPTDTHDLYAGDMVEVQYHWVRARHSQRRDVLAGDPMHNGSARRPAVDGAPAGPEGTDPDWLHSNQLDMFDNATDDRRVLSLIY